MTIDALAAAIERTLPAMLQRAGARASATGRCCASRGAHGRIATRPRSPRRRAAALRAAGVGRGDRVALMCGNRIEFLETFLGCGWLGAVGVPINTASMGPQIEYFLADSGARLLVIEDAFRRSTRRRPICRAPALRAIWVSDERRRCAPRRTGIACAAVAAIARRRRSSAAPRCSPAIRWRSSTPPAPPARPRAWCARMRSTTGGA